MIISVMFTKIGVHIDKDIDK